MDAMSESFNKDTTFIINRFICIHTIMLSLEVFLQYISIVFLEVTTIMICITIQNKIDLLIEGKLNTADIKYSNNKNKILFSMN